MKNRSQPTATERLMRPDDFIVSKTDLKGRITYGNRIFIEFSGYTEKELLGAQHNIIRHPDMPRGVFRLLWDTIQAGQECFAYVKNMAKDGSFYWVFAHVTPSFGPEGKIEGYYSVRRAPNREAVRRIEQIYAQMLEVERRAGPKEAPTASLAYLTELLSGHKTDYHRFILTL
ncbi:MAG: PAS domain-containing protein [Thiobacillaceae bacterium]|nr:PAS domain-containing protein [Thiobacillaceae bacterium]